MKTSYSSIFELAVYLGVILIACFILSLTSCSASKKSQTKKEYDNLLIGSPTEGDLHIQGGPIMFCGDPSSGNPTAFWLYCAKHNKAVIKPDSPKCALCEKP